MLFKYIGFEVNEGSIGRRNCLCKRTDPSIIFSLILLLFFQYYNNSKLIKPSIEKIIYSIKI